MDEPTRKPYSKPTTTEDAAMVLLRCYRERAGEEALFRALLSERDLNPSQARFWIGVYGRVSPGRAQSER